ncbi:MAG: 4Fe-4S dicluster domain-containing protein [Campylobacteraceae bacterium]|nr:4Fe-4S dicluster domain-containing protein [Campylobacteraceae bacterium]
MKSIDNPRRNVIKWSAGALFFGALFGGGVYLAPHLHAKNRLLRPPGALDEKGFLATCIKCGQCVQVCPYHTLDLLDINHGSSVGTPYVDSRARGCYLCDLLPCVLACPSGALDHATTDAKDVHMGIAFLKRPDRCLALLGTPVSQESIAPILTHSRKNEREIAVLDKVQSYVGKPCTLCADMCPYPEPELAIVMKQDENGRWYPQIMDACVGCGVCEEVCPAAGEAAIVVLPRESYAKVYG